MNEQETFAEKKNTQEKIEKEIFNEIDIFKISFYDQFFVKEKKNKILN